MGALVFPGWAGWGVAAITVLYALALAAERGRRIRRAQARGRARRGGKGAGHA